MLVNLVSVKGRLKIITQMILKKANANNNALEFHTHTVDSLQSVEIYILVKGSKNSF